MGNTQVTDSELMPNGYVANSAIMHEIFPSIKVKKFKSYLRARNISLGIKPEHSGDKLYRIGTIDSDFIDFIRKSFSEVGKEFREMTPLELRDKIVRRIDGKKEAERRKKEAEELERKRKSEAARIEAEKKAAAKKVEQQQLASQSILHGNYLTEKWICKDDKKYILHVGPTCSGKTYQAIEKLKQAENFGCYLAPLRLLAWEIAEKLNESGIKCDLLTGEERKYIDGAKIIASTIEMLDYEKDFDIAVIDECFMVADKDRGKSWLKAILEVRAKEVHLILNSEVEVLLREILTKGKKEFEIKHYDRLTKLEVDPEPYSLSKPKDKTAFIVFSRAKALTQKAQFEKKGYNVSILYGNLPPETKKEQIQKFISGENTICISTDVIGMGLNLPCEHVCFLELEKFDGTDTRPLNPTEIKQIGGRAGRFGFTDIGYVCGIASHHIKAIRKGLEQKQTIDKAFFGLDYNMFRDIPKESALEKLQFFKKLNCIPVELQSTVQKQDVNPLIEIAEHAGLREFDLRLQWTLVNSPIKDNNEAYFTQTISDIRYKKKILRPEFLGNFKPKEISDTTMLGYYEQHTAEIDLFTYFYNHDDTAKLIEPHDYESIMATKVEIINRINAFLVDKKKSSIKRCEECECELDITWVHKKCDSCFRKGRRSYYGGGGHDFWNDDDDYNDWR